MAKIRDRMVSALAATESNSSDRELIIKVLSDNLKFCNSQSNRSYLLFIGFATAFSLVAAADVPRVSILGIDVSKTNPVLLLLPVMAAFFLYRASCLNELGVLIDLALEAHWSASAPAFAEQKLLPLLRPPASILELEDTFDEVSEKGGVSGVTATLALVVYSAPLIWLGWSQWWVLRDSSFPVVLKVVSAVSVGLCYLGALLAVVRNWRFH